MSWYSQIDEPLKNLKDTCKNCEAYTDYLKDNDIVKIRQICQNCKQKKFDKGIYKADIVISALAITDRLDKFIENRNEGKKPVLYNKYSQTIINLYEEGRTAKEIARIIDIPLSTTYRLMKQLTEEEKIK